MTSPSDNPLKSLIREIHRRSLWQVLGIYVMASWGVLGGIGTLGDVLPLPEWFMPLALGLLGVGLPIVLATAVVQKGGPGSEAGDVEGESPLAEAAPGVATSLLTWRNALGGGVLAFALLGLVGAGWVLFGGRLRIPSSIEASIAVMPCDDQSPAGDQAPLAQGIAEGIINALWQLPDLKVINITSVIALVAADADVETIAETLDVATVLECGLQRVGDMIRIRPRLVEVATGAILWSDEIDRPASDIFGIQDAVARAVTDRLQVVLAGGEETPLVAQGTTVPGAHEAYLRGRYHWNQRTEENIRTAITEFQRAIDLDPNYSEAQSGLADSYLVVDAYTESPEALDVRTNLAQGLDAGRRAVSLAPDLGMAHASLGAGLWGVGQWESAERELERAIDLSPGYATAHHWYALLLYAGGRAEEGLIHAERALELDPVSRVISRNLGRALWVAGRIEEAIDQFRETTVLAPGWAAGWFELSRALLRVGEYEEGQDAWVTSARLPNADLQPWRDAYQAAIRYRETGEPQTFPDLDPGLFALYWVYAQSGQVARAIDLFEGLVRLGAYGTASYTHVVLTSDVVRDDPRYQALLAEAGITW